MPSHMESAITTGRWIIQYPGGNNTILIMVVQAVWITKLQVVLESSFYSGGFDGLVQCFFLKKKAKTKRYFLNLENVWLSCQGHSWTETGLPIALLEPSFNS